MKTVSFFVVTVTVTLVSSVIFLKDPKKSCQEVNNSNKTKQIKTTSQSQTTAMSALPSIQKKSWRQRVEEEDERLRAELKQEQQQLPAIVKEAKKKKTEVQYALPNAKN